jgi:hypothetical protein
MPQPDQNSWRQDQRRAFNLLHTLCAGHATTLTPFLHRGQGVEAFGFRGLAGALILIGWFGFTRDPLFQGYFVAWLVALGLRRIEAWRLERKGEPIHTCSTGWPVVSEWLGVSGDIGRGVEAAACLGCAIVLAWASESYGVPWNGLAVYIGLGAFSLLFDFGVSRAITNRQLRQMLDAKIEQTSLMERFHQWQGEGR